MPVIYENLALEGGGTKGHVYIGAAKELEKLGVLDGLQSVAGASVGAVAALLLATGWKVEKIQNLYSSLDFNAMIKGSWWDTTKIPYNLFNDFGVYRGTAFLDLFRNIVEEVTRDGKKPGNPNATFADWHKLKEQKPDLKLKDLFVEACNADTRSNEMFSYLSEHKDVPIADAVFASMKFPLYLTMHEISGHRYYDSGTKNNCPSASLETTRGQYNPKTLTIRLDNQQEINYYENGISPEPVKTQYLHQAVESVIEAVTSAQDYAFHFSPYKEHTIFASTLNAKTLDFNMSPELQKRLRESGSFSVQSYFHKNHPELTRGKYDATFLKDLEDTNHPATITDFEKAMLQNKQAKVAAAAASSPSSSTSSVSSVVNPSPAITPMLAKQAMSVTATSTQAANTPNNTPSNSPTKKSATSINRG